MHDLCLRRVGNRGPDLTGRPSSRDTMTDTVSERQLERDGVRAVRPPQHPPALTSIRSWQLRWHGLIGNRSNYNRVTYQALRALPDGDRLRVARGCNGCGVSVRSNVKHGLCPICGTAMFMT
jgi:hypothetical protein